MRDPHSGNGRNKRLFVFIAENETDRQSIQLTVYVFVCFKRDVFKPFIVGDMFS
jgi:hypothetical protein